MPIISTTILLKFVAPPLDAGLAASLISEFVSCERRFIHRDWEPSQLDGGQFAEIASRIIYHLDSGILNQSKSVDDCLRYIENDAVSHAIVPRQDALHVSKVIRTIYKFRSQRGAVHISANYTPNHMDSKLVIECVRWVMAELLRIFWNSDRDAVARAIRELLQFDVPSIGKFDGHLLVQRVDLKADEEVLLLLHYGGDAGLSRNELGRYAMFSAASVTRALQKLCSPGLRQAIELNSGNYRLTDLGSKRVRENLSEKLMV